MAVDSYVSEFVKLWQFRVNCYDPNDGRIDWYDRRVKIR